MNTCRWDLQNSYESFDNLLNSQQRGEILIPLRQHLQTLRRQLREYSAVLSEQHSWIQNPFAPHNEDAIAGLSSGDQDRLVELSCNTDLKLIFKQKHLAHFWMHVYSEYTDLSNKALMFLMPLLPLVCVTSKADVHSSRHQDFDSCYAATSPFSLGGLQVTQCNVTQRVIHVQCIKINCLRVVSQKLE